MPLIARASIGAEFEDRTSPLLLVQPEPQYLYAALWKMALHTSLARKSDSLGWRAPEIGVGGHEYTELEKDQLIFEDPIYDGTFINVVEIGQRLGQTIRLNRPLYANTTYNQSSREIANGTLISTTPINVGSEQVSVTVKRFGGPYDQVNGNVAPFGVDRFDASKSIHSTAELVGTQLQRDFDRTIDYWVGEYLALGATQIMANGYTALSQFYGGQASPALNSGGYGEAPFSISMLNQIERTMQNLNLPVQPNGRRAIVISAIAVQELKDDPQFLKMSEFHPPINYLLKQSYYRTLGNMDIFQSTTLPVTNNGVGTNLTAPVFQVQAFAPGVLGSGVSEMPRVAASSADNYGEWALVVWLMYAGFSLLDNRFSVIGYHN